MLAGCAAYYVKGRRSYFTQIDNSYVVSVSSSDEMNRQYALTAYDAYGAPRTLQFKTSRVLRDGAFLRLEYAPFCGVISWKEVQYTELPEPVQPRYTAPAA